MASKDEKRKKRPVITPSPKIPAPKRMPGGRPLQPKYEKPEKPEGTAGAAPSKIELPPPKPGKGPDRSLSGHWVELGETAPKKEEKVKPKVNVKMNLLAGLVAFLITFGVLAGVLWSQGFFGGSGGGGEGGAQTWKVYSSTTFAGEVLTITVNSSGNFVSASGWTGYAAGIGYYNINITNGSMSGTTMSFNMSASFGSGYYITGTYTGTLNAAFPNATSASGTASGTISDGLGTRALSDTWTATRIS